MYRALVAMLLAGCFAKPAEPHEVLDRFAGNPPTAMCGNWGFAWGNATLTITSTGLQIAPLPDAIGNGGGCLSFADQPLSLAGDGIALEVVSVPSAPSGAVALQAMGPKYTIGFNYGAGAVSISANAYTYNTMPYDAHAMRWWRLRGIGDGSVTIAEYSSDASSWTKLGDTHEYPDGAAQSSAMISIDASTGSPEPDPGAAIIGELDAVPAT